MSSLRLVVLAVASFAAGAALAGPFDGSEPLECLVDNGYDCLPGKPSCGPLQPVTKKEPLFRVDFANKQVRSPYRTQLLKVAHTTTNAEALVLQGADLLFAWSALIHKQTGVIKVAVADREGAYVVFGKCNTVPKPEKKMSERMQE
ncbi:MAG TPA: hypothetical protein VGD45_25220 [Steroidobacter sp.]|uniref:hypothetical protein n=1 Tax=Steroidobacter sp. TaxID=1978227 RepID=UPI002ED80EBE